MDERDYTIGEVYRLCQRIEAEVRRTNGTVTDHGARIAVLEDRGSVGRDTAARGLGVSSMLASVATVVWQWFNR